jgi:16S rRNA (guanine(966)-N(2))-methyltransferase RsmD
VATFSGPAADQPAARFTPVTRIVAGTLGGRRIAAPAGPHTRPTSDRVREGLFSALESLTDVRGARFADLYAGSGAVGLEALSRGAAHALLVESDPRAARVIRQNIAVLGVADRATLLAAKVATVLAAGPPATGPYDIVFADPPYGVPDEDVDAMLTALARGGWLAADAVVVLERSSRARLPARVEGITEVRSRRYGETTLWYGRGS